MAKPPVRALRQDELDEQWARDEIASAPEMHSFVPLKHTNARREALEQLEAESRAQQGT